VNNDQEWRNLLIANINKLERKIDDLSVKVNSINLEMNTLKLKVAGFSSIIGSIITLIINKIMG
jgi:hypothetical protein